MSRANYSTRFQTGWSEQVMLAMDEAARAIGEARSHKGKDWSNESVALFAFDELAHNLRDHGFDEPTIAEAARSAAEKMTRRIPPQVSASEGGARG